jgi:predicted ATPase
MITELKIENFRSFESLELKGLKRVNLVVGENNSGKTSLLEAVLFLCETSKAGTLPGRLRPTQGDLDSRFFRWLLRDEAETRAGSITETTEAGQHVVCFGRPDAAGPDVLKPGGQQYSISNSLLAWGKQRDDARVRVISVQYVDSSLLVKLVGKAQRRRDGEETLQRLISKVDHHVRKIRVDPGEGAEGNQVIVDLGLSELVPVSQAGQGVYRLVTILAEIIGESPDVVLIDEIENGLHHTIHEQVWAGLAETAENLGVQIFATTHSGECLAAAHAAFCARNKYDLCVIQLFRLEAAVKGRVIDRDHIDAAIAGNIELR